jgi:hypothetical protein
MKRIEDLEELKNIATAQPTEVFIQLNFGLRSSKNIEYDADADSWLIYNYIDDTEQMLTSKQLKEDTNIIEALDKGALYLY